MMFLELQPKLNNFGTKKNKKMYMCARPGGTYGDKGYLANAIINPILISLAYYGHHINLSPTWFESIPPAR